MKNRAFFPLLALLILSASTCWAGDSNQDMAIHTWGGGGLLQKVFQCMSMIIYGNETSGLDKTFNGILRIGMTVGGFCCICVALFREKFEPLIKNFFLPCIFIMCCLLVPRTTVHILDHLAKKATTTEPTPLITVNNVPYFIGKLGPLISTICYTLTNEIERVAHGTNDKLYDWTGHIYAGESIFRTKKCRIENPILEDNFREFCRECVFRDLGIGIYFKKELENSKNILDFLQKNTSRIRTMYYKDISDEPNSSSTQGHFIPCNEAIEKMNALFGQQKANTKQILMGEIGNDFQFLLGQKTTGANDLSNLIKQQIAVNILKEEIPGTLNSFASKRAELLQKENQKILGALGANSIVAMRNFFEATIYMVFPLIIFVSLLSFSLRPLLNWLHFILWVNVWPPFYVVVKFLLDSIWSFRTKHTFGNDIDLTLFNSEGLADLYSSMESIAAIAMASIPFLSWILLKGGVSQMVQLASTIMAPAQGAAAATSAEKTYGNYNFGNVNLDNVNGHNTQAFRQTYSGFLSTGSVSVDSGAETMTYTPRTEGLYVKQTDSYLREGISRTQAFGTAVQDSFTQSQSALTEQSKGFSENLSDTTNKTVGFVQALSQQFQKGDNYNSQHTTGLQEAVQFMQGAGEDYAKAKGSTYDEGIREVLSAGLGFSFGVKVGVDGSIQDGVSKSESDSQLAKTFDSESFQKHLQTITNASSGEVGSILQGEDKRLHDDFTQSFNKTAATSTQLRAAYAENEALATLQSYSNTDNVSFHQNLNQRFVDFLSDKYHDIGKINEVLEMPTESSEKYGLIQEFVQDFIPKNSINEEQQRVKHFYEDSAANITEVRPETFEQERPLFIQEKEKEIGHRFGEPAQLVDALKSRVEHQSGGHLQSILMDKDRIHNKHDSNKQMITTETDRSTLEHFWKTRSSTLAINSKEQLFPTPTRAVVPVEKLYKQLFGSDEESLN